MIEYDGTGDGKVRRRVQAYGFVGLFKRYGCLDHEINTGGVLFDNSGPADGFAENTGGAVHDGGFIIIEFGHGIVDAKTRQTCHDMFNGGHDASVFPDDGGKARIHNPAEMRPDIGLCRKIHPPELDAGIGRCGPDGQVDLFPRVNARSGKMNRSGQGALHVCHHHVDRFPFVFRSLRYFGPDFFYFFYDISDTFKKSNPESMFLWRIGCKSGCSSFFGLIWVYIRRKIFLFAMPLNQ